MRNAAKTSALSVEDKQKPFILIAAILVGIVLNRFVGGVAQSLYGLVNIGLFLVIFAIMLFVEVKDVGKAFTKVKPTTLALLTNFVFTPFFAWFLGWLFLRNYPDLWAGVVLYKLTPCIGWYLIFIDLADGDVPWGVALLIFVISLFFVSMFLIGLLVGRLGRLGYEDTTTLVFTTTARNSEAVLPVAAAAFPGHPLVIFAILIGPIVELPVLVFLSRTMLWLKERLWKRQAFASNI